MFVDKRTDHDEPYFDFYVFMFLRQHQRQRKCFLSERELKKALRDTLTRAAWLGSVIFDWFVLSMRMQVILDSLDSSSARPGSAPIWSGKKGEFRDWTNCFIKEKEIGSSLVLPEEDEEHIKNCPLIK